MTENRLKDTKRMLPKCPTGIQGFDEITGGGLPKGRPTLVCGGAGSGKTLFGMGFLVYGALHRDEPGVFMAFEETEEELIQNVISLGWNLDQLIKEKKLLIDYVHIEPFEIEETGKYDLEGLFIRLGHAIDTIGAKRVVLDTVEAIFSGFMDLALLRAELRRLSRWLKSKGVTAIITGEPGNHTLTRHGLEEYVSDCVIILDHQLRGQVSTRTVRVLKYRGSNHGTNEYPFLISKEGISVTPITSLELDYKAPTERVSTGIRRLDTMLGAEGYYRGSSILISGTAGTGKTSFTAHFVEAACTRGERALFFAFEESEDQIIRNMRSIGIDLEHWVHKGLLKFRAARSTLYGLEQQLDVMQEWIESFQPHVVVVDPISNLIAVGSEADVKSMLTRLIDFLKIREITALFTDLTYANDAFESTEVRVSSLMDTWIMLRDIESSGERNRGLYILKSRGMAHSNQIREFLLTDQGIRLVDVYLGPTGVLTGAARYIQEAKDKAEALERQQEIERMQRALERKRKLTEAQIATLQAEFEAEKEQLERLIAHEKIKQKTLKRDQEEMARIRFADRTSNGA